ncbi:hypothetical protein Q3G72_016868 [Acer saccharum]|nr:hypothetical protein Q3G72_016868 [Acer saccharum]
MATGFLAVAPGCRGFPYHRSDAVEAKAAKAGVRRFEVETGPYSGLSDLTTDVRGHFWSVPERDRVLLRLHLEGPQPGVDAPPIAITGISNDLDTEAIAWLSEDKFAIGTESQSAQRASDDVLLVTVQGDSATVTNRIALPYSLWNMTAARNQGIEGLCYAGGHLIAAGETVGLTSEGRRFAPVGRFDTSKNAWMPFSLLLTSETGKISALACRQDPADSRITVLAVERHFGVAKLLRFAVPTSGEGGPITPEVIVDFARVIEGLPNYEGVAWSLQNDIYMLTDNNMGIEIGPTEGVVIPKTWVR